MIAFVIAGLFVKAITCPVIIDRANVESIIGGFGEEEGKLCESRRRGDAEQTMCDGRTEGVRDEVSCNASKTSFLMILSPFRIADRICQGAAL